MTEEADHMLPVKEGLFKTPPGERPHLIGSKCRSCGEVFFPSRPICRNCFHPDMEDVGIGQEGRLFTFTKILRTPIGSVVQAPYLVGKIEIPEGELIHTLLVDCDETELRIGLSMELVIDRIGVDEAGHNLVGYKYRPIRGEK